MKPPFSTLKWKLSLSFLFLSVYLFSQNSSNSNETVKDIDGNVYNTITIGNQTWMSENLRVKKFSNGERLEDNSLNKLGFKPSYVRSRDEKKFGLYYNLSSISSKKKICPDGWHVPSNDEWVILNSNLKITNSMSDFNPVLSGYYNDRYTKYQGVYESSQYWSSTVGNNGRLGTRWGYKKGFDEFIKKGSVPDEIGLCIRCIKD